MPIHTKNRCMKIKITEVFYLLANEMINIRHLPNHLLHVQTILLRWWILYRINKKKKVVKFDMSGIVELILPLHKASGSFVLCVSSKGIINCARTSGLYIVSVGSTFIFPLANIPSTKT